MAREVGEVVGVDISVKAKPDPLRSKLVRLVDRGWLRKLPDGRFTKPPVTRSTACRSLRCWRNRVAPSSRWTCVTSIRNLAALRRRLKAIRSRWRILPPGKIAVIVLAVLRHDQRLADMTGGNGVSESTVRRWRDELIGLLAVRAPRPDRALKKVAGQGGEVVLIDGTLIRTQRRTGKADRRNYSGKHRSHGLHFLALTDEKRRLIWISAARPGRTHDNTAARLDHILAHLRAASLGVLADLGFRGLDNDIRDPVIVTGYTATRTHKLTPGQKAANRVLAVGRAPVEHAFAHLKNWRIPAELRTDPARATRLLRALLVLTNLEVDR